MARNAIVALGILKANWERDRRDYLENLVPLVVESLRTMPDSVVSLPQLQASIGTRFGLHVPLNPLKAILYRAHSAGFLKREHGVFFKEESTISTTNFQELEARVARIHDAVVRSLQGYARERFQVQWTEPEAEDALLAFLASDDTKVLLSTYEVAPFDVPRESRSSNYIVSAFIYYAHAQDPGLFDGLETLAKGHILATALFLSDPGRIQQKFKNTKVFLDSQLLIYACGYAGADREAPAKELLEQLHKFEAELCCFQETVDEIRGILDANAAVLRRGKNAAGYGETIDYFIRQGYTSSDIDLLAARLPEKLKFLWVQVEPRPDYDPDHVIDERALQSTLDEAIGYRNQEALVHDVDCVAAVARLRKKQKPHAIETCKAVFVTTNAELVRTVRAFFQPDEETGEVPYALTDHAVGNLMWLKNPIGAPNLPRKLLIADAYAAMQPSEDLWRTYLAEISRLEVTGEISEDDYYLLRYSTAAKRAVMEIVKGEDRAFTEGTVAEVLEIAHQHIRADLEQKVDEEAAQRRVLEEQLGVREAEFRTLVESHASQLQQIRDRDALRDQIQRERLALTARSVARYVIVVPRSLAFLIFVSGTLLTFPWNFPALRESWVRYLTPGIMASLFVLSVAGGQWGWSVKHMFDHLEKRLADYLERKLIWVQAPLSHETHATEPERILTHSSG